MLSSFSSLYTYIAGATSSSSDAPSSAAPDVEAASHVWCIAQRGRLLFAGDANGQMQVWATSEDGAASESLGAVKAHEGVVYSINAPCDGVVFSGGAEGRVCSWSISSHDASKGNVSSKMPFSSASVPSRLPVLTLAGSASGKAAFSGGADGLLRKWILDHASGTLYSSASTQTPTKTLFALALVEDVAIAGVGSDHIVRVWKAEALEQILSVDCCASAPEVSLFSVGVAPADRSANLPVRLLVGGNDAQIRMVALDGLQSVTAGAGAAPSVALAGRVQTLVAESSSSGSGGSGGGRADIVKGHTGFVSIVLALSARYAVSADLEGGMVLWDLLEKCALQSWRAHGKGIYGVTCAPPNHLMMKKNSYVVRSACADGLIKAWVLLGAGGGAAKGGGGAAVGNTTTKGGGGSGTSSSELEAVTAQATSNGWRYGAIGQEWNAASSSSSSEADEAEAEGAAAAPPPPCHVWALLSLSESLLACGRSDGDILLFELPPDAISAAETAPHAPGRVEPTSRLRGHSAAVHGLAWLGGSQLMASTSADGSIRLWDVKARRCVATLPHHSTKVLCCCCSSTSAGADALFTADGAGNVCAWRGGKVGERFRDVAVASAAHEGEVYALAIADDGNVLVSAGADQRVRLWASEGLASEGELLGAPTVHAASIFALTLLKTSKARTTATLLASADARGKVVLWNLERREMVRSLVSAGAGSICALLSPAPGLLHAGNARGELLMWSELDGDDSSTHEEEPVPASFAAHASGGVLALAAGHGRRATHVFSGTTGGGISMSIALPPDEPPSSPSSSSSSAAALSSHEGCIWCLATSGDVLLSGGADTKIRVWQKGGGPSGAAANASPFVLVRALNCSQAGGNDSTSDSTVYALLPLSSSRVVAALGDGSLQLWQPTGAAGEGGTAAEGDWSCAHRCVVQTGGGSVLCLAAGNDADTIYCGTADCCVARVQIVGAGGGIRLVQAVEEAHLAEVHALAPCGGGAGDALPPLLASASADSTIKLWSTPELSPLHSLRCGGRSGEPIAHDGAVYALAACGGGTRLCSGGADRVIKVWDLTTMDQIATLAGHRSFVTALQVAKGDNILYSASSDKTLCEWDLQTYERRRVLTGHKGGLYSLAVHHGRACSGSLDATIRVWDP